jgi:hypothetical protein
MTIYEWNMLINDKLILPLLPKNDHMWDTKHGDTKGKGQLWTLMGKE